MEKQFDPKIWVKEEKYHLRTAFFMCSYIIGNFYQSQNFACPKELLTHCEYLHPFVLYLNYTDPRVIKIKNTMLWKNVLNFFNSIDPDKPEVPI